MLMFNQYPYLNLTDINLDFIHKKLKELESKLQDFIKINTIKYADPIQWNITTQYESNTVVIDGNTGTAYLSTQPVPSGVALTNADYWTVIFTLDILSANQNITFRNDGANVIATFESNIDDWLLWNSQLYKVIRHIAINEAYVEGYNLQRYSVELFIKDYIANIENIIGALSDLTTSDTDSIVDAINSIITERGALSDLTTSDTDSIVDAINSIITERGALSDLTTSDTDSIVDAINSVITERGDLSNLNTTDKTSIVNAINEVLNTYTTSQIYHSPKEYGAIGDGVTDDTAAIQACISANNLVVFNDGEYLISSPITLHSNMHIIGNGTIYNPTEFLTSFDASGVENVVIEGISFKNGARTGAVYTATNGNIKFVNSSNFIINNIKDDSHNKMTSIFTSICHDFVIQNCKIIKSGYCGIMLYGQCYDGIICNNNVNVDNYTGYTNTYGIACSCTADPGGANKQNECYNILIDSNIVTTSLAYWEGIDTHAGDHIVISNNIVKGFHVGIRLTRYNAYTDTNCGPTYCTIKGNHVIGNTNLHNSRSAITGIAINGNQTEYNNCDIIDNTISEMTLYLGNENVGVGVEIGAHIVSVSGNTFKRSVDTCVLVNNAGIISVCNNHAIRSSGTFIKAVTIDNEILIDNNSAQNIVNFYDMNSVSNVNLINRSNNVLSNGYWQDNTALVTDVSKFVPEFVNVNPSSSPYHLKGIKAYKTNPTSGQPMGWVANGSTWLAMANLT